MYEILIPVFIEPVIEIPVVRKGIHRHHPDTLEEPGRTCCLPRDEI
jgi:hypothetical protein